MKKIEDVYTNVSINIHNLDISLNDKIHDVINEVVETIYTKISNMLQTNYRSLLFDCKLEEIIKNCFNDEKNKYSNKYDSINLEDIKEDKNYKNYIDKQEEKVKRGDEDLNLLTSKIINEIDIYLKTINQDSSYYKRNIDKINKNISNILSHEIEKYFLKTKKINISIKTATEKVYEDIKTNYLVNEESIGSISETVRSR